MKFTLDMSHATESEILAIASARDVISGRVQVPGVCNQKVGLPLPGSDVVEVSAVVCDEAGYVEIEPATPDRGE